MPVDTIRITPGAAGRARAIALVALGLICGGCARDKNEITPTTLGTDLTRLPRGRMIPLPWPGQDIVEATPRQGSPTADPEALKASSRD